MSNQTAPTEAWHRQSKRDIRGTCTPSHLHCHACHGCHGPIEVSAVPSDPTTPSPGSADPLVYTVREAAEQLRIGYSTVREEIRTGQLQSFKVGRRRLVSGEALRSYVRDRQGGGFDA